MMTGYDYKTINKYLNMTDFSKSESQKKAADSKAKPTILDPYKDPIKEMLLDDKKNGTRKQKHTAKRVYIRLRDEYGYTGGIRTVSNYVKTLKDELGIPKKGPFVPLEHDPGEAQGDFGELENYIENGIKIPGTHFSLSFPYSNASYIQAKYGMNNECLLESLQAIFEWIGGVPQEIWLDNASTMVASMGKTVDDRVTTEEFERFRLHYGFKVHFANAKSGHEKGNVERSIGSTRQNLLVPVPRFLDIDVFNRELLFRCDKANEKNEHYRKDKQASVLFEEDKKALLPLPTAPFDTASYVTVTTDNCGMFKLDEGRARYSASPEVASYHANLKLTSRFVTVMNDNNEVIVEHRRLYVKKGEHQTSMIWLPYLDLIARKPRAWMNSGFAKMVPKDLEDYLERIRNSERGKVIKFISKVTKERSFEEAIYVVTEALKLECATCEGLEDVYQRLYAEPSDPIEAYEGLAQYDYLLNMEDDE